MARAIEQITAAVQACLRKRNRWMTEPAAAWITVTDITHASSPPAHALDFWFLDLDNAPDAVTSVLDDKERERAARFVTPLDAARSAAARGYLRTLLAASLDRTPQDIEFVYGEWGKLSLPTTSDQSVAFNLAHSRNKAVVAIAQADGVGVDIEAIRPIDDWRDLAERTFAPGERRSLFALPEAIQLDGFFATWTRKEAIIKFWGQGLSTDLEAFEVTADPHGPSSLLWHADPTLASADLWTFKPCAGYWAAVACSAHQVSELRFFRLVS